jgi:4-amino-4-deoxy-L-arabinose transferase-like glycosyltransferase
MPVAVVGAVMVALLVATIDRYGYHRDELYFRVLAGRPAWGYVDQPPLTPMLAKLGIAVFGDHLWNIRIPSILCALAILLLVVLLSREFGGGTGAQVLAAAGSCCSLVLVAGHLLSTATVDLVVWLLVILFAVRALLRGQPRWWLAGLLIAGPRAELRNPWLWAGAGITLMLAVPNLVYQVTHDWPQAKMAAAVSRNKGSDDRVMLLPFQFLLLGPPLVPIWIAGWVGLFRAPRWRAVRAFAWAYPVVLLLVLVTGGQPYYPLGLLLALYAAGCVSTAGWAADRTGRRALLAAGLALNVAVSVLVALPVLPVRSLPAGVAALNSTLGDSIGWPAYVRQVAGVYRSLPAADRAVAVIVTGNYGEAGAIDRYGHAYGLPVVYSGHSELYRFGPPPDTATVVLFVGYDREEVAGWFADCAELTRLDNGVGVDNEEQDNPVFVCRQPHQPWHELWPQLQHYD